MRLVFATLASVSLATLAPAAHADDTADPWIARDKALHFDACAGIAMATYAVSTYELDARWKSLAVAGAFTLAVGAGKELLDMTGLGDPSWKDFTWDAIGAVAGLALAWGVDMLVGGVTAAHPALGSPHAVAAPAATRGGFTVRF